LERDRASCADIPDQIVDLLFRFLERNGGNLSHRARQKEFSALGNEETSEIEHIHQSLFDE